MGQKRKTEKKRDKDKNGACKPPGPIFFSFLHISSSYAKILGEKLFRTWEIPRSGSKAKDGEIERERERKLVITMAKLRMAHASTDGARKPHGPII